MDFPRFHLRIWLDKCVTYFHLYSIPPDFRVTFASLHMTDKHLVGSSRINTLLGHTHENIS
jgi:hypothetical protein